MFPESTHIIGNGFDLDLGLKTTFTAFAESVFRLSKTKFGS